MSDDTNQMRGHTTQMRGHATRRRRLRSQTLRVVALYAAGICAGKIAPALESVIDDEMTRLAAIVDVDFNAEKRRAVAECQRGSHPPKPADVSQTYPADVSQAHPADVSQTNPADVSQTRRDATAHVGALPTIEYGPTDVLPYDVYRRRMEDVVRGVIATEQAARIVELRVLLQQERERPKSEQDKSLIEQLRRERSSSGQILTILRRYQPDRGDSDRSRRRDPDPTNRRDPDPTNRRDSDPTNGRDSDRSGSPDVLSSVAEVQNPADTPASAVTEEDVNAMVEQRIRDRYDAQGGRMTTDEVRARIESLMQIAFAEERSNEDFFPTPDDIVERYVLPALSLSTGSIVLEPSAGRGNIADVLRKDCPACLIEVVELNSVRRELLALKGYPVVGGDFYAEFGVIGKDERGRLVLGDVVKERYDAIAMNPPFAKGIGLAHVKRAYDLLKPGGRLVAIVPEGYLFGLGRDSVAFQEWAKRSGAHPFVLIRSDEYNRRHDRQITINIGVLALTKPAAVEQPREATDDMGASERLQRYAVRQTRPAGNIEADEGFRPPKILTANAHLSRLPSADHISPDLKPPFVLGHVLTGANLAIESLDARGGFLLADGTGVGKTLQALIVAATYYKRTGKPVLIFTVDERVLVTSFGEDARKLGFITPGMATATAAMRPPRRPAKYTGLYDDVPGDSAESTRPAHPTPLGPDGQPIAVWRHTFGQPIRPGINLATYNDLSQFKGADHLVVPIREAEAKVRAVKQQYTADLRAVKERLNAVYPKNPRSGKREPAGYKQDLEAEQNRLVEKYLIDHPAHRELYIAKQAYQEFVRTAVEQFASDTQLVIFDESHLIKNAGDGVDTASRRSELGLAFINACPRVAYITATPADRPSDVLYLKKAGLVKSDEQFAALMWSLGYEWKEAKKNSQGLEISSPGWRIKGGSKNVDAVIMANAAMASAFDTLTEDGAMLRREIELTNLSVEIHKFEAPAAALAMMDQIVEAYTDVDEHGRERVDLMNVFGRQSEELEAYKIEAAIDLVDRAMRRGKQVIVFVKTVSQGKTERVATGAPKPGAVELLKGVLAARYGEDAVGVLAGTAGAYEEYRRLENVRQFQSGERPILIGTISSGGTGLNLDDTRGTHPREMIIVTPPLSVISVVQAIGRIVRANTKSRSVVHFLFTSNTDVDQWHSRIIAAKFSSLNAIVKGEVHRLDISELSQIEQTGESGFVSAVAAGGSIASGGITSAGGASAAGAPAGQGSRPAGQGSSPAGGAASEPRHSRFSKRNQRLDGWTLPSRVPLYAELSGTPASTLVALGGKTPGDLRAFIEANGPLIERLGLTLNVDRNFRRYNGPFLGRHFYNRDSAGFRQVWEAVLNAVDHQVLSIPMFETSPYKVGDAVVFEQDIPWLGIARGTAGTAIAERKPRLQGTQWLYDIQVVGSDVVAKAVEFWKLRRASGVPMLAYPVGSVYEGQRWHAGYTRRATLTIQAWTGMDYQVQIAYENARAQEDEAMSENDVRAWIASASAVCTSCPPNQPSPDNAIPDDPDEVVPVSPAIDPYPAVADGDVGRYPTRGAPATLQDAMAEISDGLRRRIQGRLSTTGNQGGSSTTGKRGRSPSAESHRSGTATDNGGMAVYGGEVS